jgi:hypothetical protein
MRLVKQSAFCRADNNRLQHTPSATGLPGEEGQACIPAIRHPHQWKTADVASNDIQNKQPHRNMQSSVPQATTQASEQTRMIHFCSFFDSHPSHTPPAQLQFVTANAVHAEQPTRQIPPAALP